jgi:hypothetical protein
MLYMTNQFKANYQELIKIIDKLLLEQLTNQVKKYNW